MQYFLKQVRDHRYVSLCPDTKPIITATLKFMFNLDEEYEKLFAKPRIPYDVLFAIGGWHFGAPMSFFETYDNRAKRWHSAIKYSDQYNPRVHHGATVVNQKIYCIGGFDEDEPHNSCRMFDTETKIWTEVCVCVCELGFSKNVSAMFYTFVDSSDAS